MVGGSRDFRTRPTRVRLYNVCGVYEESVGSKTNLCFSEPLLHLLLGGGLTRMVLLLPLTTM